MGFASAATTTSTAVTPTTGRSERVQSGTLTAPWALPIAGTTILPSGMDLEIQVERGATAATPGGGRFSASPTSGRPIRTCGRTCGKMCSLPRTSRASSTILHGKSMDGTRLVPTTHHSVAAPPRETTTSGAMPVTAMRSEL